MKIRITKTTSKIKKLAKKYPRVQATDCSDLEKIVIEEIDKILKERGPVRAPVRVNRDGSISGLTTPRQRERAPEEGKKFFAAVTLRPDAKTKHTKHMKRN